MRLRARAILMQAAMLMAMLISVGTSLFLTGCAEFFTPVNNNPNGGTGTTYVYVTSLSSSATGGTLSAYSLTNGVLTVLSGSPYVLSARPTSLVVSPNNAFLYVGTSTGIFLYTIGSDGTLTEGNAGTVVYFDQNAPVVAGMAVDSTSSWLIVANQNSSELDAVPIDPTTGIPPSSIPVSIALSTTTPVRVTMAPANNNVFIALGAGGANAVSFTATQANPWGTKLVTIPILKANGSDNSIAVDTTSTYLFLGETTTNQLRMLTIADLNTETDYATGVGPSAILADLSGSYVYVSNATDGTISGYTLSTGTTPGLTALGDSPFTTALTPAGLAEDSSKTYVLSVGATKSPNLWMYSFDTNNPGNLNVATTTSTGASPTLSNAIATTH